MTLEHISLIVLLVALVCATCVPFTGVGNKIARITAVVACVIWTTLQFVGSLPVR